MKKYKFKNLVEFASTKLVKAGLEPPKAQTVGEMLVMADAMGHQTHGLAFLPIYVRALKQGLYLVYRSRHTVHSLLRFLSEVCHTIFFRINTIK